MVYAPLPEYANLIQTDVLQGSYELLPSRTNIHPIEVLPGQQHKLSFLPNPATQQLIVRFTVSEIPLEVPVEDYYKSLSPNGMTVYLYDKHTDFPEPPSTIIQNRYAGSFKISPKLLAVEPGQYYINMQNLSNVQTYYSISIKL